MNYGIVVGRWTGVFSPLYYADVIVDNDREEIYASFSAFSKTGALRKAKRYLKRLSRHGAIEEVYAYDSTTSTVERLI